MRCTATGGPVVSAAGKSPARLVSSTCCRHCHRASHSRLRLQAPPPPLGAPSGPAFAPPHAPIRPGTAPHVTAQPGPPPRAPSLGKAVRQSVCELAPEIRPVSCFSSLPGTIWDPQRISSRFHASLESQK
ncbi:protein PRRC2A-like [Prionailurus viverrinus]|uniref:protein PRRC2A-like n=1 Tax=Prionailurus viverrinus TaxID=61388 RepID=UPI001FF2A8BC|nr:protein PRRC2A-like [Prionailurus viverrinus]